MLLICAGHTQTNKRHNFQEYSTHTNAHKAQQEPHTTHIHTHTELYVFLMVWGNLGAVCVCNLCFHLIFLLESLHLPQDGDYNGSRSHRSKWSSRCRSKWQQKDCQGTSRIRKIKGRQHNGNNNNNSYSNSIHRRTRNSALRMHNQCISSSRTEWDG